MSRRQFVKILFAATPAYLVASNLQSRVAALDFPAPSEESLNFLVLGDWGGAVPEQIAAQIQVAAQMAKSARRTGAKFVLNVGDNFYEDGVASVDDPQWKTKFEEIYHDPALQVPWYSLLGNHDYHDNVEAQLDYSRRSSRWILPKRYYSFKRVLPDQGDVEFFCLDTSVFIKQYLKDNPFKKNLGANVRAQQFEVIPQLKWLDESLAGSQADWKIVVGHHPIYSASVDRDQQDLIDAIYPILEKHNVLVYFNGHDHNLQHLVAGNLNMFDSGAGSHHYQVKPNKETRFALDTPGFVTAALTRESLRVDLIDEHGTLLYSATVKRT